MKSKLHTGKLYLPLDDSIMAKQLNCLEKQYEYNLTRPHEQEKRQALLKEMLASVGEGCYIEPPLRAILPELREQGYQYNASVRIGKNCWIGAGAVILPGVTIGDNTVIGAGSVVTKDIPANVVAVGNPCRVMREIGERDKEYYFKNRKIEI